MEFSNKNKHKTLMFAVLTLIVMGVSLMASTWQILMLQTEASVQHMTMSARSISRLVESAYMRGSHMDMRGQDFLLNMRSFLADVDLSSDIVFIVISTPKQVVFSVARDEESAKQALSADVIKIIEAQNECVSPLNLDTDSVFTYSYKMNPAHYSYRRDFMHAPTESLYFSVGLSTAGYKKFYESYRSTAMLQGLYILGAACFIWIMAVTLISRRTLAGKAKYLERFQAQLLDKIPDALLTVFVEDGTVHAANPAAHETFGFKPWMLVGREISVLPVEFLNVIKESENEDEAILWRQVEVKGQQFEVLISRFQGGDDEPLMLLLIRNRTHLHNLERSLAEAEKRGAVATLAAGVAHEIRNPLAALRGFAQYFAKKFEGKKPEVDYANAMVTEADRLNRVITDLLYLTRSKALMPIDVDLERLSKEVETLLHFDFEAQAVALEFNLQVTNLYADSDALKQSIINLLLNSLDALSSEKNNQKLVKHKKCIQLHSEQNEEYVLISIIDNGCGMAEEEVRQATEAFYTSKAKGTGLGLALVAMTMHEHGGKLVVESVLGEGTVIKLYFPLNLYKKQ